MKRKQITAYVNAYRQLAEACGGVPTDWWPEASTLFRFVRSEARLGVQGDINSRGKAQVPQNTHK